MKPKQYARKCDQCNKGMNEGYLINGGELYYCSDTCLHKNFTPEQWDEMHNEDESESYYTDWNEDEPEYIEALNGEAIPINY